MAVEHLTSAPSDGTCFGQSATDLIGFYGKTPIVQRASAAQGALTTGATTTAQLAAVIEIIATLTALGIWKGSA